MDEFALGSSGKNSYFGDVINPRNKNLLPGGSSAGCASAIASGMCDFAIATDHGGSIRLPAACCNISGIKFSREFFSTKGCLLLDTPLDCIGALAPSARDLHCLLKALSPNWKEGNLEMKLLIPCDSDLSKVFKKIAEDFKTKVFSLQDKVKIVQLKETLDFEKASSIRKILITSSFSKFIKQLCLDEANLPHAARALLSFSKKFSEKEIEKAMESQLMLKEKLLEVTMGDFATICTPALGSEIPNRNDQSSDLSALSYFYSLANVAEQAAVIFPTRNKTDFFPLQLIGPAGSELKLTERAAALETI